ncbi:MAG TPA: type II toxin-antitoxin system RelE/ParE family toxin [Candidatus Limnocylindria bacterium]|nr:type II toxin-antitoxin system RelE/ParE family toxin [Candidatus Limnocylindria bacterium]
MSFVIRRPRLVEEDQLAAAVWYEEQQPGLGDAFLDESETVISSLATNALLYSVRFADVRCLRLRRFRKYGVYYLIRGDEVRRLAIHHGARDPGWLRQRRRQLG